MMESSKQEVVFELPVRLRVHKDCHVERPRPEDFIPPSTDPITGVSSKNIVVVAESKITARLFLPKITDPNEKLAVLVYFHGGAFVVNTPFTTRFHNLVTIIVSEANVVAVSVDYRKAPEHPIPAAYEDLWAALKWVASHSNEDELESWLFPMLIFNVFFWVVAVLVLIWLTIWPCLVGTRSRGLVLGFLGLLWYTLIFGVRCLLERRFIQMKRF